jgi:hypothetical protein
MADYTYVVSQPWGAFAVGQHLHPSQVPAENMGMVVRIAALEKMEAVVQPAPAPPPPPPAPVAEVLMPADPFMAQPGN